MPTPADLRHFIMDVFNDEELITFCFDHFPEVQNNFTSGMSKGDKVLHLLDYCQRRECLPDLLEHLRAARPQQFDARFGAETVPQSTTAAQATGSVQSERNTANISGGLDLDAQDVSIGGDAVGRDKIMQAGGHIIIAKEGATVIVGNGAAQVAQPVKSDDVSPSSTTTKMDNPFYIAGRINDPKLFFGREQLVRELRQELSKRTNVSLVGESQMGKSSLLYYLYATREEWLPGEAIEYLDLQRVFDEADFCEMILQRLNASGNTLRDLRYALATCRVILLLDEVERLAEPDFSPRLHDLLRSLAQGPNFKMCVASQRPLEQVFPPRGTLSDLHNIFTRKTIGSFTESEARRFVVARLQSTGISFTEREVTRLIGESKCHPAKLQHLARDLFDEKVSDA